MHNRAALKAVSFRTVHAHTHTHTHTQICTL